MPLDIHVNVATLRGLEGPLDARGVEALLERAARAAFAAEGVADAELSITLLDDEGIAEMNARYLQHEGPTDVISFELGGHGVIVGDVYIGWEQALRQAATFGVPPGEELARLAIHGTLHILGYDHPEGEEREQSEMWHKQEDIVRGVVAP